MPDSRSCRHYAALGVENATAEYGVPIVECAQPLHATHRATMRETIFHSNLALIEAHNADRSQTFTMAANAFADLTSKEFATGHVSG